MYNILQINRIDGRTRLMLGMSVADERLAVKFLTKYTLNQPAMNASRVAFGSPPLDCEYVLIECETEFTDPVLKEMLAA